MPEITDKKKLSVKELLERTRAKKNPSLKEQVKASKPIPPPAVNHGKVINYYVEYEDGTALLAQGKHAHLIYRFTMEAQKLATMHAFAYYEGPAMTELSKQDAIALLQEIQIGEEQKGAK